MSARRRTYTREFKLEALQLLQSSGKGVRELEHELGIGEGTLRYWERQMAEKGEDAFPGHGRLPPEQQRIHDLERENEILREERDILKKAIAIFSQHKP